jgi:hypothetical protein
MKDILYVLLDSSNSLALSIIIKRAELNGVVMELCKGFVPSGLPNDLNVESHMVEGLVPFT